MWLIYRNVYMQLKKAKDMQLKVDMQRNIGEEDQQKGYIYSLPSSLVFFYGVLFTSSLGLEEKKISHTCIKGENPYLQKGKISHTHILSYPL